ncbi:hypothetical protein J6590_044581 [Homalodisca vitripennis]|nr:hypothetical protein J6590_044581 [Homalodisca vitripennis]
MESVVKRGEREMARERRVCGGRTTLNRLRFHHRLLKQAVSTEAGSGIAIRGCDEPGRTVNASLNLTVFYPIVVIRRLRTVNRPLKNVESDAPPTTAETRWQAGSHAVYSSANLTVSAFILLVNVSSLITAFLYVRDKYFFVKKATRLRAWRTRILGIGHNTRSPPGISLNSR